MGDDNEKTKLCWSCEERPATTTYALGRETVVLCARCLDCMAVHDAMNEKLLHIIELAKQERYDDVFACLDVMWEANRHRDHDKWLERSIASHRAFVLWEAGKYIESLRAYEQREQLGFERIPDRWSHAYAVALNLQALGRHQEALAVFEEAFSHQHPDYFSSAAYHFRALVELSENAGQPVNEKWRSVAVGAAEDFAIEMPVRATLAETLLVINETTRNMPPKRQREWEKNNPDKVGT